MEHCMVWCKHGCCALSRRVSSSFCCQGIPGNYHNCRSPPRRRRGVLRFWQRVKPSLRGHGDIRISHTNDSLPECCNIAITLITPALPLTKKSQIALHLKRAHDGVPCDQTKGRNSQDLWIGVLRCGGKISCRKGTKLSERSGTPADDPFSGRHPTSHERRSGLPWDASYHDGPAPWDIGLPPPSTVSVAFPGGTALGRIVPRRPCALGYWPAAASNSACGIRARIRRSGARCGLRDRRERSSRRLAGIVGSGR